MQTLAGFVLDRIRITFQLLHMLLRAGIFLLKIADLFLQSDIFGALLLVNIHTVLSEHSVISKENRRDNGHAGRNAAAHAIEPAGGAADGRGL